MWSLDAAIRDHVGDARDYAYDWNAPGGVPGAGPMLPTDDVGAMLRQIFEDPAAADQQEDQEAAGPVHPARPSHIREQESSSPEEAAAEAVTPKHDTGPPTEEEPQRAALPRGKGMTSPRSPGDAPKERTARKLARTVHPRRHGRAKPA
jgi:hypothetical protein